MKPTVFLDFDDVLAIHPVYNGYGVLNAFGCGALDADPELWLRVFDAVARRNLRALHDEFDPTYVITSSWASHLQQGQISEVLRRTGLGYVDANLSPHWRTPRDANSGRLSEIEAWLDLYSSELMYGYVIIDDAVSGGALYGSRLQEKTVFCDAWVGFTYPKQRTARKILQRQDMHRS